MIPGERTKCATQGCRRTTPAQEQPWLCPQCRAVARAEAHPSVVYRAQKANVSVGEICRRFGRRVRPMDWRPRRTA